jgi:hypothetical protein
VVGFTYDSAAGSRLVEVQTSKLQTNKIVGEGVVVRPTSNFDEFLFGLKGGDWQHVHLTSKPRNQSYSSLTRHSNKCRNIDYIQQIILHCL